MKKNFEHAERIYRIGQQSTSNRFGSPAASAPIVADRFPEMFSFIEEISRTTFCQRVMLGTEEAENMEECIAYGDERFFHLFNVEWLYGDADSALSEPDSAVLTSSLARKYFGSEEKAYGNTLSYMEERPLKITGVIADLPDNTYLGFRAMLSINLFYELRNHFQLLSNWEASVLLTYARFDRVASGEELLAEMQPAIDEELSGLPDKISFNIRSITDLAWERNANRIKMFGAIGAAILLIGIINFVNLTTARASTRAVEVGVKLSLGAGRRQLMLQFLGESIALVCLAMMVALAVGELLVPIAGNLIGANLHYSLFTSLAGILSLLLVTLAIAVLAGLYPAFYLSGLKPVQSLKKQGTSGKKSHYFRSALVVIQFSTSIVLLVATFVFLEQIRFSHALDRGFEHDNIVIVPFPEEDELNISAVWPTLQNTLSAHPGVIDISLSQLSPLRETIMIAYIKQEGSPDRLQFSMLNGEPDFLQFYDIPLLAGHYFTADITANTPEDSTNWSYFDEVILNEAALQWLNWPLEDAVGRTLYVNGENAVTVIGVVKDLVQNPAYEAEPYIYTATDNVPTSRFIPARVNIRLRQGETDIAMEHIRQVWSEHFPDELMQPLFLTDFLRAQTYNQETQLKIFAYASTFAILIACFGLFGLATFNAERRTKEIGVRKVMGGSVWSIVLLLTNDFSKLVLISNLIAWPVAYFAMNRWLENFAYRIDLTPVIFIGSGLIALSIAWVTVGGAAAKAASRKPVLALRYE